jgi:hypothetical protein
MTAEQNRLLEARDPKTPWKKWGPYLSERHGKNSLRPTTPPAREKGVDGAVGLYLL